MDEIIFNDCTSYSPRTQFANGKIWRIRWIASEAVQCHFITGSYEKRQNEVAVWSILPDDDALSSFKRECVLNVDDDVRDLLTINNELLAVALNNGDLTILNLEYKTLSCTKTFESAELKNAANALCNNENVVFVGYSDGSISSCDVSTSATLSPLVSPTDCVKSLSTVSSNVIASSHSSGRIDIWDTREDFAGKWTVRPSLSCAVAELCDSVTAIATHPAESHLIGFGTGSGAIGFLDTRMNKSKRRLEVASLPNGPIWEVAFHPAYPDNFYGVWNDGALLHFEVKTFFASEIATEESEQSRANTWMTALNGMNDVKVATLLTAPLAINSVDVSAKGILTGADNNTITLIDQHFFT